MPGERAALEGVINPVVLYGCLAVGGIGVALALPRPKVSPQLLGALIAAIGFGGIFLALALASRKVDALPNLNFYLFALIALGSGLRVITHPRPVYAALYFILTILSSSALYLIAGAEFMAFALIIIYAGAILITYLFVIMLATQAPSEEDIGSLSGYDAYAREPMVAAGAGFALLALLSGLLATGVSDLRPAAEAPDARLIEYLPGRVERALVNTGLRGFELAPSTPIDSESGTVRLIVTDSAAFDRSLESERTAGLVPEHIRGVSEGGEVSIAIPRAAYPENMDGVGWALIAGHPMALELAGIILLMAMLGAVVLARKQIEIGESEKAAAAGGQGGHS